MNDLHFFHVVSRKLMHSRCLQKFFFEWGGLSIVSKDNIFVLLKNRSIVQRYQDRIFSWYICKNAFLITSKSISLTRLEKAIIIVIVACM